MPIYADPSNYRLGSYIPHCDGEIITPRLEEFSGADYMLSAESFEITKRYHVQEHLESGAILLALKVGKTGDLVSSIGDRLRGHLVKMLSFDCHPCQRGLLTTGYNLELNGEIYIGEQSTGAATIFGMAAKTLLKHNGVGNWKGLNTSQLRWILSGGVIYPTVPRLIDLPTALAAIEREVIETHKDPSRYHFETLTRMPDQPNPDQSSLQVLKAVPDGCAGLISKHFPGIGVKRALEYYEFYSGDLIMLLINLCDAEGNWPPGWSEKKARDLNLIWQLKPEQLAVKEPA